MESITETVILERYEEMYVEDNFELDDIIMDIKLDSLPIAEIGYLDDDVSHVHTRNASNPGNPCCGLIKLYSIPNPWDPSALNIILCSWYEPVAPLPMDMAIMPVASVV